MDKDQQVQKDFLKEQFEWCKEQDRILEEIETKLHLMKEIVEYALRHELASAEINELNGQLDLLKRKVHSLEQQLSSVAH